MSVNLHGTIRDDNYAEKCAETAQYKLHRLALLRHVVDVLDRVRITYSLDGGTLMGAWRDGTMLVHDDDVDLVVYTDTVHDEDPLEAKRAFLETLAAQVECLLDDRTRVRVVTSYALKLEVYRPEHGIYLFETNGYDTSPNGGGRVRVKTDYHNVCCDLTLLLPTKKDPSVLQIQHAAYLHLQNQAQHFLPVGSIAYEGGTYNAPHSAEGYLRDLYGYLGTDAVYDKTTGLYKKR